MSTTGPEYSVRVERETALERGWRFVVVVERAGGVGEHEVSLSWVDYEHWSHGRHAPERVVRSVVEALLASDPGRTLPARFDASTARRWCRDLDERMWERE